MSKVIRRSKSKPTWKDTLLHYFIAGAVPVDGIVWVKPERSAPRAAAQYALPRPWHKPA